VRWAAEIGAEEVSEDEYRAANPGKLRLYDIGMDEFRDVTQSDVDQMMRKLTELMAPKVTPCKGKPSKPSWPRLYVGEIEDGDRKATVGILT
jgi:hypothetical protein